MPTVLKYTTEFDPKLLTLKKTSKSIEDMVHEGKYGVASLLYDGQPLRIESPFMKAPFGMCASNQDDNSNSTNKFNLALSTAKNDEFLRLLDAIDFAARKLFAKCSPSGPTKLKHVPLAKASKKAEYAPLMTCVVDAATNVPREEVALGALKGRFVRGVFEVPFLWFNNATYGLKMKARLLQSKDGSSTHDPFVPMFRDDDDGSETLTGSKTSVCSDTGV